MEILDPFDFQIGETDVKQIYSCLPMFAAKEAFCANSLCFHPNFKFMETILLHSLTVEEFMDRVRAIVKEELKSVLQQDQLLTKEGALKLTGASNAAFLKAVNAGIVKPQLVKGRTKAMYLESEVLKIVVSRKRKPS